MTIGDLIELLEGYPKNARIVFRDGETEDNFTVTETELRIERGKNFVIATLDIDMGAICI